MDPVEQFEQERRTRSAALAANGRMQDLGVRFVRETAPFQYVYNFSWMGLPIIQLPQDIVAVQEIIWATRPDLVIETGVARGGSVVCWASLLELTGQGEVVGIDVDIRQHNRAAIEASSVSHRITLLEGSSTDEAIVQLVAEHARKAKRVMVMLDSNHTHEHVLAELRAYARFVTRDCYLIVFDTMLELLQDDFSVDRAWGVGNNPMTALDQFLAETHGFERDAFVDGKLLATAAPRGYLRRVHD